MITAICRAPSRELAACELTFLARAPIDPDRAAAQHAAYCEALRECGARVVVLPALSDLPDAVFVEDPAVVLDEVVVLTTMGTASRRPEVQAIAPTLEFLRAVVWMQAPARLEGGDVLRIGRTLWVGLSTRTDPAGLAALDAVAGPLGYTVISVPVRGSLHLKTAVSALSDDTVLVNPEWVDPAAFGSLRVVLVHPDEPFAANVLRVGDAVLASAGHRRTNERAAQHGATVREVCISELAKAEAGLTCMSLLLA